MQLGDLRQRKYKKIDEEDDEERRSVLSGRKRMESSLPEFVGYAAIVVFVILLKFFSDFENSLPEQIKVKDAGSHPGRFIGERAELQLKRLTDLGTRVVGSYENEVLAVDFLKREISFVSQEANKIHNIEIDIQKPTGSYYLSFKPHGFKNYYANIQNVVVKLSSTNVSDSVLMNCHYDTVPESPGASDNGVNCVVMLEILRVLASESRPLKNNVIFLFNGAEENPLQASHGFVSQHKWKDEVKVLINLDSAGAGGREILFQTSGESWLVQVYAKAVPRPTAGVQAEELFHYGIIPSDTDFRVFRDFGQYRGFDIAHCTNGYVYHTKFDKMDFVRPGVYQNTGDNMLALVRELVNSSLETTQPKTRIVYFDVFTLFMIVYTEEFGICLDLATVVLSFLAVYKSAKVCDGRFDHRTLVASTGVQLLSLLSSGCIAFFISKTLDYFNATMSWYLRPWLIIPLYVFPIVFTSVVVLAMGQSFMKKDCRILFVNGAQIIWTIVLFLGTVKGVRSSFMLMMIVLLPSIVTFSLTFRTGRGYLQAYLAGLAFPVLFVLCQSVRIFTVIIPMTGRMGPHTNPEILIGVLAFLTSTVYLSQMVPILLSQKRLKRFLVSILVVHVLTMIGIAGTNVAFPYDGDVRHPTLQRFYVLHCERTFHDGRGSVRKSDSGFFVLGLDRNDIQYVAGFVPELKTARDMSEECTEVFCGFPVFTSRFIGPARYSHWIPAPPPTIHHPTSLEIVNQTQIAVNVRRIRILITGPDHITVGLSPRKGVELIKWSLDPTAPLDVGPWNDRRLYMIYYSHGLMGGTLEFDLNLEVNETHSNYVLDIAVVGHYMHDAKFRTKEFAGLLSKFPAWAHLTPWTTTYKSWLV